MKDFNYNLIDLGLPSGTLWMDRNLGASSPEDAGLYFAWGEIQGYTVDEAIKLSKFDWSNYKFGAEESLTKYNSTDGLTTLETTDDAVLQNVHECAMPTYEQMVELIKETDVYCIKTNGTEVHGTWSDYKEHLIWDNEISHTEHLSGFEFRNKTDNSIKIFVPCSHDIHEDFIICYDSHCGLWSNRLNEKNTDTAWALCFDNYVGFCNFVYRNVGIPVRGVKNKEN